MDGTEIALGRRGLEQLAFFFVFSNGLQGKVGVLVACRVFSDAAIDQAHTGVERDPFELLINETGDLFWIKQYCVLDRQAGAAVSSRSHPEKAALERMDPLD